MALPRPQDDVNDLFDNVPAEMATTGEPVTKTYMKSLSQWKSRFTDFQNLTQDNRKKQENHYRYYDKTGQLSTEERQILKERGQPDVIINRFRVAIHGIIGIVGHSREEPRGLARGPDDDNASDVATDVLRYVTDVNRYKHEQRYLMKDLLLGGCCALLVGLGAEKGDVRLVPIRWEEFFYDPRSKRVDFEDARYTGIAKWMYADEVIDLDPENASLASAINSTFDAGGRTGRTGNGSDDTFDDRPINQGWIDTKEKRVQVVEIYEKIKGRWVKCVFWEGGIISEEISPYLDDKGRPCNPIVAEACYVDIDNNRVGYATDLIDLQDEINKRRQKALWEISSNQIEAADPSAIEVKADEARREAGRPDGVIPYGWKKVAGSDKSAGNLALLNEAKGEMERFSPNAAMLGRQGADTSGRAMLARQQGGLIELDLILGQFEDFNLRAYKQIWFRCKQDWDEAMFIRVTDDIEDPRYLGLNQPRSGEKPVLDEAGQPVLDEATQQPVMQTVVSGEEFGYDNAIGEMDIDIKIDTSPATATIMQEQISELRSMVASNPAYAQEVPFEVFLEMTNMPRKRQLIKKIQAFKAQAQEAAQAEKEQAMQMQIAELEAKIAEMRSQAGLNDAKSVAALAGAEQGETRTAVQADKTLAGIDAEATRVQMEGARTTNEILATPKPDAGDAGEPDGDQ